MKIFIKRTFVCDSELLSDGKEKQIHTVVRIASERVYFRADRRGVDHKNRRFVIETQSETVTKLCIVAGPRTGTRVRNAAWSIEGYREWEKSLISQNGDDIGVPDLLCDRIGEKTRSIDESNDRRKFRLKCSQIFMYKRGRYTRDGRPVDIDDNIFPSACVRFVSAQRIVIRGTSDDRC